VIVVTDNELLAAILARVNQEVRGDTARLIDIDVLCLEFPQATREQIFRVLDGAKMDGLIVVTTGAFQLTPDGVRRAQQN